MAAKEMVEWDAQSQHSLGRKAANLLVLCSQLFQLVFQQEGHHSVLSNALLLTVRKAGHLHAVLSSPSSKPLATAFAHLTEAWYCRKPYEHDLI